MGVPLARLDEVADVRLGRQRSPKNHVGKQMRPYMRAANVGWGGLRLDDVKTMNFTDAEMSVYQLESGDLLLGEASGSAKEVGKPAIWSGEIDECAFQNTLLRCVPEPPNHGTCSITSSTKPSQEVLQRNPEALASIISEGKR